MRKSRGREKWLNAGLVLISVFLAAACAEIFLRISWFNYWKKFDRSVILREFVPSSSRRYSRKEIIKGGEYVTVRSDEDGFLLPNYIDKKSGKTITIAFLGGSTTECFWVKEDLRFPYLTGRMIADSFNCSVRVINAGVSGANTQHSLNILLNKIINYKPDIVVIMQGTNDAGVLMALGNYKTAMVKDTDFSIRDMLSAKLYCVGFLRHMKAQYEVNKEHRQIARRQISEKKNFSYPASAKGELNNALAQFSVRLKIFIDAARDMGATPVLMTQPYHEKIGRELTGQEKRTFLGGINYMDMFNNETRQAASIKGCPMIDLDKRLQKDKRYFYDYVHYNDEGSERVADIIARSLGDIVSERLTK